MIQVTFENLQQHRASICIVGLGYVGLPLAALMATKFDVIGFDINEERVSELDRGFDRTRELSKGQLMAAKRLRYTSDPTLLASSALIIVTVPTPIDEHKNPDLSPLRKASKMIGKYIKRGATIVYESTVYPGCTEEECIPHISEESGLLWKRDFFVGYSPERINPGDREHTVDKIRKVVSGDSPATASLLARVYGSVITAGVHLAESIATAEAAKVIENTQRDLNIALMNELAQIFDKLGINTLSVLEAAGTKWNFLPFRPGLVGGHCIGVDPYYLTFKATSAGCHPEVILAGRRINDLMGKTIAERTVKKLIESDRAVKGAKILILGWTFKENVPDVRNTRIIDIYRELLTYGTKPLAYDPQADRNEVAHEYGVELLADPDALKPYDAVIAAVRHTELMAEYTIERIKILGVGKPPVLIDVKGFFSKRQLDDAGLTWWQL